MMRKLLSTINPHYVIAIGFIVSILVVVLYWFFPFNSFFYFWDQQLIHHPTIQKFVSHFFVWDAYSSYPGSSTPVALGWVTYRGFMMLFVALFGPIFGQILFVTLLLVSTYLANYYFIHSCGKIIIKSRTASTPFITGLFAFFLTFNIYSNLYLLPEFSVYSLFFLFLPLVLTTYTQALHNKQYFFSFALMVLLISQSFVQPSFLIVFYIYLFLYSILLLNVYSAKRVIFHFVSAILLSLLIFSYLLIPIFATGSDQFQAHVSAMGGAQFLDEFHSISRLTNVLAFKNFNLLFSPSFYTNNPALYSFVTSSFASIIAYSLIFILFATLSYFIINQKKNRLPIFITVLITSALLITSAPDSLHFLLRYLWLKFPFIQVLRIWDQKMGHFYLYILVLSVYLLFLSYRKTLAVRILVIGTIALYSIGSLIGISGNMFFNRTQTKSNTILGKDVSSRISFPDEYLQLGSHFPKGRKSTVLILPVAPILSSDKLNGVTYAATSPFAELMNQQTTAALTYTRLDAFTTKEIYEEKDTKKLLSKMHSLGYTHVLVRKLQNDNAWFSLPDQPNISTFASKLNEVIKPIYSTQYFDLYHIGNTPIIQGKKVSFVQHNPTRYTVTFTNYDLPQKLTFYQSYRKGWKLYAVPSMGGKRIEMFDVNHVPYLDLFNQWTIDPNQIAQLPSSYFTKNKQGDITFKLELYYQPQDMMYIGIAITLLGLVCSFCVGYVNLSRSRKHV